MSSYENLSSDTIDGMSEKLRYWYKDDEKNIVETNFTRGSPLDISESVFSISLFSNFYLKGYVYFSIASFLSTVVGCSGPASNGSKTTFHYKFLDRDNPINPLYVSLESEYKKHQPSIPNVAHNLFDIKTLKEFNWEVKNLYELRGILNGNLPLFDQIQSHLFHLSLEFLFKAIEFHTRGNYTETHDLNKLFSNFSKKLKIEMKEEIEGEKENKFDLEGTLKKYGNLDVSQNRYWEKGDFPVDTVNTLEILSFIFNRIFPIDKVYPSSD